jgi:hypothetical protein
MLLLLHEETNMVLKRIIRNTAFEAELLEPDTYLGPLGTIAFLGLQATRYGEKWQVRLEWPLDGQTKTWKDKSGKQCSAPWTVGVTCTESYDERSKLRPIVEGVLGRALTEEEIAHGFDLFGIAGKRCSLDVDNEQGANGRTYAVIKSVSPAPGTPLPIDECLLFDPDQSDAKTFARLPKWMQEAINKRIRTEPPQEIKPPADKPAGNEEELEDSDSIPF